MKSNDKKKPFFASFLEKQVQNPEEIQGGGGIITSINNDSVTLPTKDMVVTTRTSDGPISTLPAYDTPVTLKYPSDSDEGGFNPGLPGLEPLEP
ncbi:Serine endopeptidase inhibitors [Chryseobacterium arachidis]|uniref:Serine endopeptidase inhibitors n=1 Tax=Chryseobacterium arachidis TaxID=1416778 RepID=A0A1M4TDT6_9FLAO|nr:microviridin/marinostatin family tricyclic proteinase inhibitor [Chryseobacterium arachidis]SHE42538.1 Serine endopeptidase inhibitors [Chryseobacterium arachidis]